MGSIAGNILQYLPNIIIFTTNPCLMRTYTLFVALICMSAISFAQQTAGSSVNASAPENIYSIKKQYQEQVLHNPTDKNDGDADNDLAKFNRWFNFMEPRCWPSGNIPEPGILLKEYDNVQRAARSAARTTTAPAWSPIGPLIPYGGDSLGLGRVNCIVIDPLDTSKLYAGTACGGVWISHNAGASWASNTDNFPALSVADIAVNPKHTDTLYAATGDGYGYEAPDHHTIFWGGVYSAGVMQSADGGSTWHTTGLSRPQTSRDLVLRLLIHPNKTNILLASTRNGIYRTTDAGNTWSLVDTGEAYTMEFRPSRPDTVYAVNGGNFKVSYNAGLTWSILYGGISTGGRCRIAVTPASPRSVWVLNDADQVYISHNEGQFFTTGASIASTSYTYGNYSRVMTVSPVDSNYIIFGGVQLGASYDGGMTVGAWATTATDVHSDNHAAVFNPQRPQTIYIGCDGGVYATRDDAASWSLLTNKLLISQIYRTSSSRQNPSVILCGLQDNYSLYNDGVTGWQVSNGPYGDGMACAIYSHNDNIQIASIQYGYFQISYDMGATYGDVTTAYSHLGYWTSPVVFSPNSSDTIYFGLYGVYASYDGGATINLLPGTSSFGTGTALDDGVISLAISQSNSNVIYAANFSHIIRTTDAGATWTDVTGSLPVSSVGITHIAIDYVNPMLVYVTTSGYSAGNKVFVSTTGGSTWSNISGTLPNIPANCIATDIATPGALFVGTDMGMYYKDSSTTSWAPYGTGLPNVIVDDIEVNYTNNKVRAATYGRGLWECDLMHRLTLDVKKLTKSEVKIYPNPAKDKWQLIFPSTGPADYTVKVRDVSGRIIHTQQNTATIDAHSFASGVYEVEVTAGDEQYRMKAVKE